MTATLRAEVGPVDDEGHLYVNGQEVVALSLNGSKTHRQELEDGEHEVRFVARNSGGFAWKAKLRLTVDGQLVSNVDRSGFEGPFGSNPVYERTWQIGIKNGQLDTF